MVWLPNQAVGRKCPLALAIDHFPLIGKPDGSWKLLAAVKLQDWILLPNSLELGSTGSCKGVHPPREYLLVSRIFEGFWKQVATDRTSMGDAIRDGTAPCAHAPCTTPSKLVCWRPSSPWVLFLYLLPWWIAGMQVEARRSMQHADRVPRLPWFAHQISPNSFLSEHRQIRCVAWLVRSWWCVL